jgi:membrane protease YdiL (CAAX protease family)
MKRLGLVKPAGWQIGVAILMVFVTAAYDFLWNPSGQGVGGKLAMYNAGTFAAAGGNPGPAAFLALMTGVCAGAGEEILMRGALQPVLGIVPAAILHGALHGQFQHAPILIIQVAGWSILMGIVRRYTNTTTTLITHATWNFITTFLFAFNP